MAGTLIVDKIQLDVGNTFQVVGNTGSVLLSANAAGITFAAGSAAAPSITTNGDTNTGIFFPAADTIAFAEGGVESARFDSSGNFGIGTSSPSTYANNVTSTLVVGSGSNFATIQGRTDGPVNASNGVAYGVSYLTNPLNGARIWLGSFGSSGQQGIIAFFTKGTDDNTNQPSERGRFDANGNFFIGGTTRRSVEKVNITADGQSQEPMVINDTGAAGSHNIIAVYRTGGYVGGIASTATATQFNTSSDYRLKENVQPMTGALTKVAALKPCTYTWKVDGSAGQGFIAHELQAVVPDAVTGEKDAVNEDGSIKPQGVDTSFLIATLTAAIQEQQAMIKTLQDKVAALEAAQ